MSKPSILKKAWDYVWHGDSAGSWIANIIIAFVIIRFILYPFLGLVLGTSFPVVAVISESMEHGLHNQRICGQTLDEFKESFDSYWNTCGKWYNDRGISKAQFESFPLKNGFDKGDVIILWRANNVKVGDVLVFNGARAQPIIHRVVKINDDGTYQTKGDHNSASIEGLFGETRITEERVFGKGIIRLPYLGWIKILFVDALKPFGINITR